MTTNILLFLIAILLSYFVVQGILNYFKDFKNRCFTAGVKLGSEKSVTAVIEKAKEGRSFSLKNNQEEVKLIMLTKKNAKSIRKK